MHILCPIVPPPNLVSIQCLYSPDKNTAPSKKAIIVDVLFDPNTNAHPQVRKCVIPHLPPIPILDPVAYCMDASLQILWLVSLGSFNHRFGSDKMPPPHANNDRTVLSCCFSMQITKGLFLGSTIISLQWRMLQIQVWLQN